MSAEPENAPQSALQPGGESIDIDALRRVRGSDGRFLAGLPGPRLAHGLRARTLIAQPELAAAHAEMVRAIEADLGSDLSALKAAAVREAARLMLIVDSLGADLMANGVLTAKGRNRAALSAYLVTLRSLESLMTKLGLERRSRSLPTTVDGVLAGLQQQERR